MVDYSSFVKKRGSLEILLELREEKKSFNELKNLDLSPNTILTRLREAQRMGLVDVLPISSEKRTRICYELSKDGTNLISKFDVAVAHYETLQKQLKELSSEKQQIFKDIIASLSKS